MTQLVDIESLVSRRLEQFRIELLDDLKKLHQTQGLNESLSVMLEDYASRKELSDDQVRSEFIAKFNKFFNTNIRRLMTTYRYHNNLQSQPDVVEYLKAVERENDGKTVVEAMIRELEEE